MSVEYRVKHFLELLFSTAALLQHQLSRRLSRHLFSMTHKPHLAGPHYWRISGLVCPGRLLGCSSIKDRRITFTPKNNIKQVLTMIQVIKWTS